MLFVATTTGTAAYYEITKKFWGMVQAGDVVRGWLNIGLTAMMLVCVAIIVGTAVTRWYNPRPTLLNDEIEPA